MQDCNAVDTVYSRVEARNETQKGKHTMASVATKEIRVFVGFGSFRVQVKDSNGEWVSAEADGCSFATREEAQECIDQWLRMNSDMQQAEDLVWFA